MAHGVNPRSRLIRFSKNSSFHYFTVDEMALRLMKLALDEMALYRFQRYLQQNGICKASIKYKGITYNISFYQCRTHVFPLFKGSCRKPSNK